MAIFVYGDFKEVKRIVPVHEGESFTAVFAKKNCSQSVGERSRGKFKGGK